MDPAVVLSLAGGLAAGAAAGATVAAGRLRRRVPDPTEPVDQPAAGGGQPEPEPPRTDEAGRLVPDPLLTLAVPLLEQLPLTSALVGDGDQVVWSSDQAWQQGLVRNGRLADDGVARAVRQARGESRRTSVDVEPARTGRGRRRPLLTARAVPVDGGRLVVVVFEDRSEARRVDAVRRDFVANVSHELKTPVGALSLLAEASAEAADDPEAVRRFAERMRREADRLTRLVNELIDLSRLQSDDPLSHAADVPVDEVVAAAVERVTSFAAERDVRIRVEVPPDLTVLADREQVTTALRNLLDNAVAYSPGGTHVTVAARAVDDPPDVVSIAVTDQGIGIPERDLARIFERFYRVDPARSRATGGTGLGLSIVKNVAQNHGGDVTVWSREGSGSTFTLRLPAGRRPVADAGHDHPYSRPRTGEVVP